MKKIKATVQVLILLGFICLFSVAVYSQLETASVLENQIAEVEIQITKENKITEKLIKEQEYSQSDEFIEKVARERLGLVKYDEIIFVIETE